MNLTNRKFDFPYFRRGEPDHRYMIACTQRTGSTLLATTLWRTGALGAPMSYFNPSAMESYRKTCDFRTDEEFVTYLQTTRTSPNGVFAYKMSAPHWQGLKLHMPFLHARIATRRAILLRRRNTVAQAISLYKAEATGSYFPESLDRYGDLKYDGAAIDKRLQRIDRQNAAWLDILEDDEVEVVEAWYEDILETAERVQAAIAELLDIRIDPALALDIDFPRLSRLSNATSADWEARYRAERGLADGVEPKATEAA
jgi:trehalose 2-sulfotransferase